MGECLIQEKEKKNPNLAFKEISVKLLAVH